MPSGALNTTQQTAWEQYLHHERDRVRHVYLAALASFIESLEGTPPDVYRPWAAELAARVVDHGESIPVRMPLFEHVLFPALLSGYNKHLPGYARWLAGFANLLYHRPRCAEALDVPPTDIALLRRALADDVNDERARLRLVDLLAENLAFAIHEVPWGVLWGVQTATREECARLRRGLDEFEEMAKEAGVVERYDDLIAECRLHFSAYERYLANRDAWSSYEVYLDVEVPDWREA